MTIKRLALTPTRASAAALLAAGLTMVAAAAAQPPAKKFSAALNIGQENGVAKSTNRGAAGRFSATLDGTTLHYQLTFSHLSGPATAAHIHGPAVRHVSAGVLVPLCGPCTSPKSGIATLTPAQIRLMNGGKTYVNVHTAKNPNGEIRGQITLVK